MFSLCSEINQQLDDQEDYLQGRMNIVCQGLRLNHTKPEKVGVIYGKDFRLHWNITDPMPRAMVNIPSDTFIHVFAYVVSLLLCACQVLY